MEEIQMNGTKLSMLMGRARGTQLTQTFPVGHALLFPDCPYYIVKMWMFGGQSFYLSRRKKDPASFTLFARKVIDPSGRVKLLNPVGSGRLNPEFPDYIEVHINLLHYPVFIELLPSNETQIYEVIG